MEEPTKARVKIVEYSYHGSGFRRLEYGTRVIVNDKPISGDMSKCINEIIETIQTIFDVVEIERTHEVW
jgi:hypothetical protein